MKKVIISVMFFTCIFMQGCGHEQFAVSYQTLAKKMTDTSLQVDYSKVTEEYQKLTAEEYEQFMPYQAEAIVENMPAYKEAGITVDQLHKELIRRNTKSLELYGIPYNQLTLEQAENLIELYPDPNEVGAESREPLSLKASCNRYYYPYPTANTASGNVSCSTYFSAGNVADSDCDWEFVFYAGPVVFSNIKTKGTTWSANQVLNAGGVNARNAGSGDVRLLVGKGRISLYYPVAGPGGFKTDFKLNGKI